MDTSSIKNTVNINKSIFMPYDTINLDGKPKRASTKKEMNFEKLVNFITPLTLPLFKDIAAAAILAVNDVAPNALKSSKTSYNQTHSGILSHAKLMVFPIVSMVKPPPSTNNSKTIRKKQITKAS
jgi:hypothetical protein